MTPRLCSLVLTLLITAPLAAQVAVGDQHWAARAEGHVGGRAKAGQIDAAIAAFQRAVAQNPNDLEARWKLLRAYRFKGAYVALSNDEKRTVYSEAKKAGEDALAALARELRAKGIPSISKGNEKQIADAARTLPGAGDVFLWDAVNWGEWALAYGKMAAAREGAADRIRHEATIADLVDPAMEDGAPSRVLGRLHDQTPRIPFITGWASEREAVRFLKKSLAIDPANKVTRVFFAEALVEEDSDAKPEAIRILRDTIAAKNAKDYEVEDEAASEDARALLKDWGA